MIDALHGVRPAAAGVRAFVAAAGAAAVALVPQAGFWSGVALLGAVLAAATPRRVGSVVFVVAIVVAWAAAYGRDGAPPVTAVILLAVLVHLVQSATALAAAVPLDAYLSPSALARWASGAVPGAAVAVAVGVAASVIGALPGWPALDVVGAVGVVLAVGVVAVLFGRVSAAGADSADRRSSSGS